jgi:hypothetical protein
LRPVVAGIRGCGRGFPGASCGISAGWVVAHVANRADCARDPVGLAREWIAEAEQVRRRPPSLALRRYWRARPLTRDHVFPANGRLEVSRACTHVPARAQGDVPVSYPRLVACS